MCRLAKYSHVIGQNLQNLRLEAGLSRKDIGEILKVSVQQVQKYESGKNRLPMDGLYILKMALDVPYDRFFEHLDPAPRHREFQHFARDSLAQAAYEDIARLTNKRLKRKIRDIVRILAS